MKKITNIAIITVIIALAVLTSGCTNTISSENSYPALIAWNYMVYGLSVETVAPDSIDTELGQIKRITDPIPKQNGDSNVASVGSRIYKLKNVSALDAIAVDMDGKLYKAYQSWPLQ